VLAALIAQPVQAADQKSYFSMDAGLSIVQDIEIKSIAGVNFPLSGKVPGTLLGLKVPSSLAGTSVSIDKPKFTMSPGFRFDLIGGYNLSETVALELEAGLLYNAFDKLTISGSGGGVPVSASARLSDSGLDMSLWQVPVFVNGVYTFKLDSKFKPFLGAGVGGVFTLIHMDAGGLSDNESDFTFAFQGMAGVKYQVSDKVDIGVTYKFLGSLDHDFSGVKTDGIYSHSFLAALTVKM
jgi:opacity protein-like surface antigen